MGKAGSLCRSRPALALLAIGLGSGMKPAQAADDVYTGHVMVDVKRKPSDKRWAKRKTRTLEHLARLSTAKRRPRLSPFGGLTGRKVKATGFFHAKKIDGRWWLVDPLGHQTITVGVNSVYTLGSKRGRALLGKKFGSRARWAAETLALVRSHGFNTLGCWSRWREFRNLPGPIPYTTQWNFMSSYGKKRGGTYQQPGHTGYPGSCIFVFGPEFETFCDAHARKLSATKDDPYLLGHFSDNELPFKGDALDRYLKLPAADPGHKAAREWLDERRRGKGGGRITDAEREAFLELVAGRYFRIVARAIKKHDPNHLYLGSRLHGGDLRRSAVFKGCAPHVDVIAINWYGAWTPDAGRMARWVE